MLSCDCKISMQNHHSSFSEMLTLTILLMIPSLSQTEADIGSAEGEQQYPTCTAKCTVEVVAELVMDPKQTPNIRRALLQDSGKLCCFFGHRQSNDSVTHPPSFQ
ncbi:serine/threonine-protein kinase VPS15-like [Papaver somniferum]|uniref:serine/threonine-protein kinase VPS15-like n=1 Tax=Papaver somniferum TaxID=3469 RepID=UPI000E6F46D7|nr:serine/threonine-protein kinase VPS15-like [Papaver somniferum]